MPAAQSKIRPASTSATVGFRLDPEMRGVLEARAGMVGVSPHELGRIYVVEGLLAAEERQRLREEVSALQSQIKEIREELAHAVQTLLVSAGQIEAAQAEEWVQANFNLA